MNLRICTLLALAALSPLPGRADEQVRRVQEELRKRNLYFGEVDGRASEEINSAVRRYQQRKGFPASGTLTSETLRALDLPTAGAAPAVVAEEWPEGPVLKSDSAREVPAEVREYLEKNATGDPPPIAEAASAPEPEPEPAPAPATSSPPVPPAATPAPAPPTTEQTLRAFVQRYLQACEEHSPEAELGFYAEEVNYFDQGRVAHSFIARDVRSFYARWPQRHYELLDCRVTRAEGADRDVTFTIAFHYEGEHRHAAGRSVNHFRVRLEGSAMHFTVMKEQRLRS